jgi:hypothetical protein
MGWWGGDLGAAGEGTEVGGAVHGVAHLEGLDGLHVLLDELVVDLLLHVDALHRAARLTGVEHRTVGQRRRRIL